MKTLKCAICGNQFKVKRIRHHGGTYPEVCSNKCRWKRGALYVKRYRADHPEYVAKCNAVARGKAKVLWRTSPEYREKLKVYCRRRYRKKYQRYCRTCRIPVGRRKFYCEQHRREAYLASHLAAQKRYRKKLKLINK